MFYNPSTIQNEKGLFQLAQSQQNRQNSLKQDIRHHNNAGLSQDQNQNQSQNQVFDSTSQQSVSLIPFHWFYLVNEKYLKKQFNYPVYLRRLLIPKEEDGFLSSSKLYNRNCFILMRDIHSHLIEFGLMRSISIDSLVEICSEIINKFQFIEQSQSYQQKDSGMFMKQDTDQLVEQILVQFTVNNRVLEVIDPVHISQNLATNYQLSNNHYDQLSLNQNQNQSQSCSNIIESNSTTSISYFPQYLQISSQKKKNNSSYILGFVQINLIDINKMKFRIMNIFENI